MNYQLNENKNNLAYKKFKLKCIRDTTGKENSEEFSAFSSSLVAACRTMEKKENQL